MFSNLKYSDGSSRFPIEAMGVDNKEAGRCESSIEDNLLIVAVKAVLSKTT